MQRYDDEYINDPIRSKVNITAVAMMIIGLLGIWELVEPFLLEKIQQTVLLVGPVLVITFRTFFTGRKKKKRLDINEMVGTENVVDYCKCSQDLRIEQVRSDGNWCRRCSRTIPQSYPQE